MRVDLLLFSWLPTLFLLFIDFAFEITKPMILSLLLVLDISLIIHWNYLQLLILIISFFMGLGIFLYCWFLNYCSLDLVKNHFYLFSYSFSLFSPTFYYFFGRFNLKVLLFTLNLLPHQLPQTLVNKTSEEKKLNPYSLSNQNYHQIKHQSHQITLKYQKQEPIKAFAKS